MAWRATALRLTIYYATLGIAAAGVASQTWIDTGATLAAFIDFAINVGRTFGFGATLCWFATETVRTQAQNSMF